MFDLSPMRPWEWSEQVDLAWWSELVEARTLWDDAHASVRATAKARTERDAKRGQP